MPRTIEHIAATYQIAAERREAGKDIWDRTVNIKDTLSAHPIADMDEFDSLELTASRIAAVLRASLPSYYFDVQHEEFDFTFNEAVESLEDMRAEYMRRDKKDGFDPVEEFNDCLEAIYDWADINRVWLGMRSAKNTPSASSPKPRW